jgi:acetyltransferase AlgX (SGNH hydrolase-like protein)
MIKHKRSHQMRKAVLISIAVFIWLAALVFYWSVDPTGSPRRHCLAGIFLSYLLLWSLIFFWSNTSKVEKAQRFLLTSVSVALTVGLLELLALANFVDFRLTLSTLSDVPWEHPDNLLDPKLVHIHKPYYRQRFDGIEYRYDQHGLRNEVDLEVADIVVIGDSFIEGWRVSAADLLTSQLAKQLSLTVANLGQSHYGPQQELELLRRYGLRLHPKVCVWAFYEGNDLWDVEGYNRTTSNWERFSKKLHSFKQRSFTRNALLAVKRILDSMRRSDDAVEAELRKQIFSGVFEGPEGRKTTMIFVRDWHPPLSASEYEALREVPAILSQASELCRANGAKFLLVFIPTKFQVYGRLTELNANTKPPNWVIDDLRERLEAVIREDLPDVNFLDLTMALTKEAKQGSLVYFPQRDTHWSPEGHRVAAIAIAQFLEAMGIRKEGQPLVAK